MEENPKPTFAQRHKNDIIDVLTIIAMIAFFARKEIIDCVPTRLRELPYLVIFAAFGIMRNLAKYGTIFHPSITKKENYKWWILNIAVIAIFFYAFIRLISSLR